MTKRDGSPNDNPRRGLPLLRQAGKVVGRIPAVCPARRWSGKPRRGFRVARSARPSANPRLSLPPPRSRALVLASRQNELSSRAPTNDANDFPRSPFSMSAKAGRLRQHSGRVCYPKPLRLRLELYPVKLLRRLSRRRRRVDEALHRRHARQRQADVFIALESRGRRAQHAVFARSLRRPLQRESGGRERRGRDCETRGRVLRVRARDGFAKAAAYATVTATVSENSPTSSLPTTPRARTSRFSGCPGVVRFTWQRKGERTIVHIIVHVVWPDLRV